jgi:hypothetical protein
MKGTQTQVDVSPPPKRSILCAPAQALLFIAKDYRMLRLSQSIRGHLLFWAFFLHSTGWTKTQDESHARHKLTFCNSKHPQQSRQRGRLTSALHATGANVIEFVPASWMEVLPCVPPPHPNGPIRPVWISGDAMEGSVVGCCGLVPHASGPLWSGGTRWSV